MDSIVSKPTLEKNLVTCKPSEALAQMVKIRELLEKWLKDIELSALFEEIPGIVRTTPEMTDDEKKEANKKNTELLMNAIKIKGLALFDNALKKYPEETLAVLALSCFVEPEHVDDYTMGDYINALVEMKNDKVTAGFFTLAISAVQTIFSIALRR